MGNKRFSWSSIGRTTSWVFAAALAVMPFAASAQLAGSAQVGNAQEGLGALTAAPRAQAATAVVRSTVTLEALPQISAASPAVATAVKPTFSHHASETAYQAAKARAAAGLASAPTVATGETVSPPTAGPTLGSTSGVETAVATVGFVGNNELCNGGLLAPSDMAVAVGDDAPQFPVLQAVNNCIAVFTKSGAVAPGFPKSLASFWGGNFFLSDPRAIYDPANHRYILIELGIDRVANKAYTLVAASQSDNPAGAYFIYAIASDTANAFGDFPRVGQDHQAIYLATNIFAPIGTCLAGSGCSYLYEQWDILPKAPIYAGGGFTYWTFGDIAGTNTDTTQPANVWQPTDIPRAEFLVGSRNFAGCFGGAINGLFVWAISNPVFVNASFPPEISVVFLPTANNYTIPQNAAQPGTSLLIDTGDCRISGEVTYSAGSLFAALTTGTGAGFPGTIHYEIHPFLGKDNNTRCTGGFTNLCPDITAAERENEIFLLYCCGLASYYPTQQPDGERNVTTVLSMSGNGSFPVGGSIVYIGRRVTQPPPDAGSYPDSGVFLIAVSTPYIQPFPICSGGACRWGGYTGVSPNFTGVAQNFPAIATNRVWFSGMFTGGDHNWSTAIGEGGYTALNQQ